MGNKSSSSSHDRRAIQQIVAVGFSETEAANALEASAGDPQAALNLLLSVQPQRPVAQTGPRRQPAPRPTRQQREEEELQRAIAESQHAVQPPARPARSREEDELQRVLAESQRTVRQDASRRSSQTQPSAAGGSNSNAQKQAELQQYAEMLSNQPVALDTLVEMMSTIMANPGEAKYRKVYLTNKAFLNKVGRAPGAVEFLKTVGFKNDVAEPTMSLRRDDIGLLWLGKSVLEAKKEVSVTELTRQTRSLLDTCSVHRHLHTCERVMCCSSSR